MRRGPPSREERAHLRDVRGAEWSPDAMGRLKSDVAGQLAGGGKEEREMADHQVLLLDALKTDAWTAAAPLPH